MLSTNRSERTTRSWRRSVPLDLSLLLLSIFIQLVLGLFFGHLYDSRINIATGYLVASGQDPYIPQDLTNIFHNNAFQGMTTIGYPPTWPLILGLIYRVTYAVYPNFLVYNLAIKIPIIAANIGLAYLVARILKNLGANSGSIRKAWLFLLFSPFLYYFGTAWGQFDVIVALLTLYSLVLLDKEKLFGSVLLLALAVSLKPIGLPVLPAVLIYLFGKSHRQAIFYFLGFMAFEVVFCVVPFIVLNWDPTPIYHGWNAQFTVAGGLSYLTFFELLSGTYILPGNWWLLGVAWIPALGIALLVLRKGIPGFVDLLKKSTALVLIFFLTRTWTSEQNIILIIPFVLILTTIGEIKPIFMTAIWTIPLIFTVFNATPPQLLFPFFPDTMTRLLKVMDEFRTARIIARTATVIPWLIAGWWLTVTLFKKDPSLTGTVGQIELS